MSFRSILNETVLKNACNVYLTTRIIYLYLSHIYMYMSKCKSNLKVLT